MLEGKTFKEVSETIAQAKIWQNKDGSHKTWEEVYKYSPTGELSALWTLYPMALWKLGRIDEAEAFLDAEDKALEDEMVKQKQWRLEQKAE